MSGSTTEKRKEILAEYREHLERAGKSANTVKAYVHDVGDFATWFEQTTGEGFAPNIVDPREVTEYRGWLQRKGYAPATVNRRLIALRRFFDWAKQQGRAAGSPFDLLEGVRVKEQKDTAPRWLTHKEKLGLLRAVRRAESARDLAIVQTLLGTGLRISELAALELSDLEIKERSGRLQVRAGKGRKARFIPLSNRVRKALGAYLEEREDDEERSVFLGQRGPLTEWGIRRVVKKYAYHTQLEDVTAHTLRHTFAKDLVDAGTPLDQVATLLGHESLDTTRVYTQPSERDLEKAVRRAAGEIDVE
jgi:integrase/recombinase XerC